MEAAIGAVGMGHNSSGLTRCIFRAAGDRGYTKLKNTFLQDRRISDETRGLVARLLSLPDDWEVTVQSIIASGKAGRDKVYRMLKEAEEFGYMQPEKRQRQIDGTLGRQIYVVSDDPETLINRAAHEILAIENTVYQPHTENPEVVSEPCTAKPDTGNTDMVEVVAEQQIQPLTAKPRLVQPCLAQPLPANPHETNKDNIINNPPIVPPLEIAPPSDAPDEYPSDFEEFWKVYPRREGKGAAFKAWKKLKLPQKRRAWQIAKRDAAELKSRGQYCPLPATWLNQARFDDDPTTRPKMTNGALPKSDKTMWDRVVMPETIPMPADEA